MKRISVKINASLGMIILAGILLSAFTSAFAVGISGDLNLNPGQSFDAYYDIMNNYGGGGDIMVEGKFLEGSEIASFSKGDKFNVPAGSVVSVAVRYKIPTNAAIGTVYPIKVIFKTVSEGTGSGSVSFAEDVVRTLSVSVGAKPAELPAPEEKAKAGANVWMYVIIILIIVIIFAVWFSMKKKRN